MTGLRGALRLVPLLLVPILPAADSPGEAARELARRIPGGFHGPVALAFRNLSDLSTAEAAEVRRVLEGELRGSGGAEEIRVTITQNLTSYLLVAEVKRGEERQVAIAQWSRAARSAPAGAAAISIEKTLLAEQPDPILDVAKLDSDLLVLEPGRVLKVQSGESAAFGALTLPRDARGRLVVEGGTYLAYLPGTICSGAVAPLEAHCRDADEAWPLERGAGLRAYAARERNYFDGRVSAGGAAKSVPSFYTAAAADGLWIFIRLDGRAYLYDASLEPIDALGTWGSDAAAVGTKCGNGGGLVLAARAGDGSERDTIRVYQIRDRRAVDTGATVELPGPVTALWPLDENSAAAVARDPATGKYAAYRLAITCGR